MRGKGNIFVDKELMPADGRAFPIPRSLISRHISWTSQPVPFVPGISVSSIQIQYLICPPPSHAFQITATGRPWFLATQGGPATTY